ncbi:MAG: hypothetical protein Q7U02_09765, partial [Desulfosalsimonadaceae bacterium]|nr:hypothetical protein [Desulfosalsimonadaceae bacterium]
MNKIKVFKCQMLFNLAAQTVSPFFHEKQPARDAARWAKTLRHRDRSACFESGLPMPNWSCAQPVECILIPVGIGIPTYSINLVSFDFF